MKTVEIKRIVEEGLWQVAPEVEFDTVDPDGHLRDELDIDSFDFLNFLISLNETLGVDVPESDYEKLVSLNDVVQYLEGRLQAQE